MACMSERLAGISVPSPSAPCGHDHRRTRIASNASNAASHAFMLDVCPAARNELFMTTSPAKSTRSSSTRNPVSPRVCVGPTKEAHVRAAQIERVVPIECDVGLPALRVFQQLRRLRRARGKELYQLRSRLGELGLLDARVDVCGGRGKRQVAGRVLCMEVRRCDVEPRVPADFGHRAKHRLAVGAAEARIDDERRACADDDADVRDERHVAVGDDVGVRRELDPVAFS